jgi:type IV secretory pathway component VirB8
MYGSPSKARSHWTATIAYRTVTTVAVAKRELGFNAAGLRVVAYRIHCDTNCGETQ